MERPRFTMLHPEGSYNASKDIIERLLLDNMQDEVFILQSTRGLDEETRREVRGGPWTTWRGAVGTSQCI